MSHLDEGRLLELRDDALGEDAEAWSHLEACDACASALEEARGRVRAIDGALGVLDGPVDLEVARATVRARVSEHAAKASGSTSITAARSRRAARGLSRAAGILLLTAAGAAAALPGSPVREWVSSLIESDVTVATELEEPEATAAAASDEAESAGVRVDASGVLRVTLRGLAPGATLSVRWVPGSEAAVFAPVGSRFSTGQGHVEADLGDGAVRVELPSAGTPVTLVVDGTIFLRRSAAGVEVPVASTRTADGIDFVGPAR